MNHRSPLTPFAISIAAATLLTISSTAQVMFVEQPLAWLDNSVRANELADIDGDGDLDLLYAPAGAYELGWFENLGDGNFWDSPKRLIAPRPARKSRAADFDGDGDIDVIASASGGTWLMRNNGNGTFQPYETIAEAESDSNVIADIDGDGDLDIVTNAFDGVGTPPGVDASGNPIPGTLPPNAICWFENLGTAGFVQHVVDDFNNNPATAYDVGDMDADGDLDIIAANGSQLGWFENLGNGTFVNAAITSAIYHPIQSNPSLFQAWELEIQVADVDQDDRPDVAAVNAADYGLVSIAYNTTSGFAVTNYPVGGHAESMRIADVDADGDNDLLVSNVYGLALFERTTSGFLPPRELLSSESSNYARVADLNGDGQPEILYGPTNYTVSTLRNVGEYATSYAYGTSCYFDITGVPMELSLDTATPPVSTPTNGSTVTFYGSRLPTLSDGTHIAAVVVSFNPEPRGFSIDGIGATGCSSWINSLDLIVATAGIGDSGSIDLALPAGLPRGANFAAQCIAAVEPGTVNPAGLVVSNGVRCVIAEQ